MKKLAAAVVVVAVVAVVAFKVLRPGGGGPAPATPAAPGGPQDPAAPGGGLERWSASDEEMERLRADADKQKAELRVDATVSMEKVGDTLKARFAPGEKPTLEAVRRHVGDIMSTPDRLWNDAPLEKVVQACLKEPEWASVTAASSSERAVLANWRDTRAQLLCSGAAPDKCSDGTQDYDCHEFYLAAAAAKGKTDLASCTRLIVSMDEKGPAPAAPTGPALEATCAKLTRLIAEGDKAFCAEWSKNFEDEACDMLSRVGRAECSGLDKEEGDFCRSASALFKASRSGQSADCGGDLVCLAALKAPAVCGGGAVSKRHKESQAAHCKEQAPRWRQEILKAYTEEAEYARASLERLKNEMRQAVPTLGDKSAEARLEAMMEPVDAALKRIQARGQGDNPQQKSQGG